MADEEILQGGNASGPVLRSGNTVRKPWAESTAAVHHLLRTLIREGVDVPRPLGRDGEGRQVLEYVSGPAAMDRGQMNVDGLRRVGAMVRAIHDSSPTCSQDDVDHWKVLIPAPCPELICHNDLAPWNLILGERWVFIDWDGAGPSSRLWDLAYAAQSFAGLWPGEDPHDAGVRLRAFTDGYGASKPQRSVLPGILIDRVQAMYELLHSADASGRQPWARMYRDGHGSHWKATGAYVSRHIDTWRRALGDDARSPNDGR